MENLGAWRDICTLPNWITTQLPGWDTTATSLLLDCLIHTPIAHFGDLDPNGVRIMLHLRSRVRHLKWFVPEFWSEYISTHGLPTDWPDELDLSSSPRIVQQISRSGIWLEQERIILDPRMFAALQAILD